MRARTDLLGKLQARRSDIEGAIFSRIEGIADPRKVADPEYVMGLRTTIYAALGYGFAAVESMGERSAPRIPIVLRAHARHAARNEISLDTVLRSYFAGYALLTDFLIEETEEGGLLRGAELKRLLRTQASLFDRVLAAVSDDYNRESNDRPGSGDKRRAEHVKRLLAGEQFDSSELAYDLDVFHVGVIASGRGAVEAVRALAEPLDHRLLLIRHDEEKVWAWIGMRREFDPGWFDQLASNDLPAQISIAVGEPGRGIAGWRRSHQQAGAALPIAQQGSRPLVRYADVALPASALQDELLLTSLRELYLRPLSEERDNGEIARDTLRAYFNADRNISSSAAALGVSRRTVANRLQAIEARIGCTLGTAGAQLEAALRLHDMEMLPATAGSAAKPPAHRSRFAQ